jgi:hypothetical protein
MPQLAGSIRVSTANASPPAAMEALRNKIQQLEKDAATQRQMEVMQRRFDRQKLIKKWNSISRRRR